MKCDKIFNRHIFVFSPRLWLTDGIDKESVDIVEAICSCGAYCCKNGTLEKNKNILLETEE